jgi:hypothetical protein
MCFTRKVKREQKRPKRIYPEPVSRKPEFSIEETITCSGCYMKFQLSDIKMNCQGCDQFFHCKIAGTCYGENCINYTRSGIFHRSSWCTDCVPKIPENKWKSERSEPCICHKCHP